MCVRICAFDGTPLKGGLKRNSNNSCRAPQYFLTHTHFQAASEQFPTFIQATLSAKLRRCRSTCVRVSE